MSHVYISYSRSDGAFVDRLVSDLRSAGITIWRDIDNLLPGEEWASTIRSAIEQSAAVIYFGSRNSIQSPGIKWELAVADNKGIPLVPIALDTVAIEEMPVRLIHRAWLDFRDNYETALNTLIDELPPEARQDQPVEQEQPKSRGYVFISYCEEDADFVTVLRDFLKDRGYGYWDYQESDRNYHSPLFSELEGIIREAAATLSILSPDWKRSKWTPKEYVYSEEVGIPVFLLMVREMEPTLLIAGIPYIDFTKSTEEGFKKLDRELRRKKLI